jgi:hypothetical protein
MWPYFLLGISSVGLGVAAWFVTRGAQNLQLSRRIRKVEVTHAELQLHFDELLESHKRLRSKERMQELRDQRSAPSANRPVASEIGPPSSTAALKHQLRIQAGLIPRPAGSSPAPSDA